ncbi:site-specific integrase [Acidiphilium cryptum]
MHNSQSGSKCSIATLPIREISGRVLPIICFDSGHIFGSALHHALQLARTRSIATITNTTRSIVLLLDFYISTDADNLASDGDRQRFLTTFALALQNGTSVPDGIDPTGLNWKPRSLRESRRVWQNCEKFLIECRHFPKGRHPIENTWLFTTDLRLKKLARTTSKSLSLFAHLKFGEQNGIDWIPRYSGIAANQRRAIGFPTDKIMKLITTTLENNRASKAARLRDALAFILLAYGGIRSSELFHIWITDIVLNDSGARAFLRHPSDYTVKRAGMTITRRSELSDRYNLIPRHMMDPSHPLHAGWKGISFDYNHSAVVYWIPPVIGKIFANLHMLWVSKFRPVAPDHPYYFTSVDIDGDFGGPWTRSAFRRSFKAACARIGLQLDQAKGISPHGMRHAYGIAATTLGLSQSAIQQMLHHRHPLSQEVYKQQSFDQVTSQIQYAYENLKSETLTTPNFDSFFWKSDPQRLFNTWRHS